MTYLHAILNTGVPPQGRTQPSTLLIRADATRQIGNGHVMRCLALAAEWQARGGHVVFLTYADNPAITARIDQSGAERISMPAMHPDTSDLPELLAVLHQRRPAWTLLDGYHFAPCYQETVQAAMRASGGNTLVLDDTAHQCCYHADALLNQNVYADTLPYTCDSKTVLLLGARYALLRPEFAVWHNWQRVYPQTARNILVTMGGTDPDNVTLKVVHALSLSPSRDWNVKIVAGPGNPHFGVLRQAIAASDTDIQLLPGCGNMGELMAWADIAVAAAGSTALELAYMQVPVLSIALADNQRRNAVAMTTAGTMQTLGWHDSVTPQSLAYAITQLSNDLNTRRAMGFAGRNLVDGEGAKRIVDAMQQLSPSV